MQPSAADRGIRWRLRSQRARGQYLRDVTALTICSCNTLLIPAHVPNCLLLKMSSTHVCLKVEHVVNRRCSTMTDISSSPVPTLVCWQGVVWRAGGVLCDQATTHHHPLHAAQLWFTCGRCMQSTQGRRFPRPPLASWLCSPDRHQISLSLFT